MNYQMKVLLMDLFIWTLHSARELAKIAVIIMFGVFILRLMGVL